MLQRGHVPRWIPFFNAIARVLLVAGVPMGFNGLVTIPGRRSGLPRTTPVAIIAVAGRRWVWAPAGDVQWVRNLRAADGVDLNDPLEAADGRPVFELLPASEVEREQLRARRT
jgi:hypothetical protein